MPFIGFLGPTWEPVVLTRILHRHNEYYHRINEYSREIFVKYSCLIIFFKIIISLHCSEIISRFLLKRKLASDIIDNNNNNGYENFYNIAIPPENIYQHENRTSFQQTRAKPASDKRNHFRHDNLG